MCNGVFFLRAGLTTGDGFFFFIIFRTIVVVVIFLKAYEASHVERERDGS